MEVLHILTVVRPLSDQSLLHILQKMEDTGTLQVSELYLQIASQLHQSTSEMVFGAGC